VSPVIGVILMVAITVILAAVIGTFVLGLGDQVSENAPQAQFTFENNSGTVTATHDGGDPLPAGTLSVTVSGSGSASTGSDWDGSGNNVNELTAGDTVEAATSVTSGDTIRLVWTSQNSDKSATVGKYEA
jgi:flagellin-like protein